MTSKKRSKKKSNKLPLIIGIIAIIVIVIGVYAVTRPSSSPSTITNPTKVLLQTSAGNITIQLAIDKPITTANFINIVQKGWYDGTKFHRVIAGFMIQGGEISQTIPTIKDEIGTNNHNTPYTIAMAKTSSPNSATSEFFINVGDNSKITYSDGTSFDGTYTVFGSVISGRSVVDAIANAQVTANPNTGENSQPVNPVTLIKASIIS